MFQAGRLARFFGGTPWDWMNQVDGQTVSEWVTVLDCLEAREMQDAILVAAYPKLKKAEQQKISRRLQAASNPRQERRAISTADMARMLGDAIGNK